MDFGLLQLVLHACDQSKPEFSFRSWIGMLFSAGLGVGLVFFGVAEPMSHFMVSPFPGGETETVEAARMAMGYSFFHWGISQWSIFGVAGAGDRILPVP